jgi:hypothetical protein
VAGFYEYLKPGETILNEQLFRIKAQKIAEMLVVFDGMRCGGPSRSHEATTL